MKLLRLFQTLFAFLSCFFFIWFLISDDQVQRLINGILIAMCLTILWINLTCESVLKQIIKLQEQNQAFQKDSNAYKKIDHDQFNRLIQMIKDQRALDLYNQKHNN